MDKPVLTRREEVWMRAWCAVASNEFVNDKKVPEGWANTCLEQFDKKFPEQKNVEN